MKPMIPVNLDLEKHIVQNPIDKYNFSRFSTDRLKYILGLITSIPARSRQISDELQTNGGFTPIYSKSVQSYVQEYSKYLQYLIDNHILVTDGTYISKNFIKSKRGKSKGYKYADLYQNVELISHNYSKAFEELLRKRSQRDLKIIKKEYNHLIKWLTPHLHLTINADLAYEYIKTKRTAQINNTDLQDDKKLSITGVITKKNPNNQYSYSMCCIEEIESGDGYCIIDDTIKRMHTNLTSINKELRNMITYKGETLYVIDIVSSQPYLTLTLFNKNIQSILKNLNLSGRKLPMLKSSCESVEKEDFKLFASLVSDDPNNGVDFYEHIYNITYPSASKMVDRSKAKAVLYEVLFSKNRHRTQAKATFTKSFPTIDGLYRSLKKVDHTELACLLQSIESYAILQRVTKSVSKRYPDAPLFTIHDSVATTSKYRDVVRQTMIDELTKLTGYPPKLKIDTWAPENLDWGKYRL